MFICADHVRCSSNTRARYLVCVLGIIFWPLIQKVIFLLFSFLSVKKLLFLFYSHSVRTYLFEASVQSVLNHGSCICFCCRKQLEYRRSEPCVTPWVLINPVDSLSFTYVYCFLVVKYDLISLKGVSLIPQQWSLDMSMS